MIDRYFSRRSTLLLPFSLFACTACLIFVQAASGQSSLDGQVVLVTGSTSGLGREVALRTADLGAHVIVHGRNEERGAEVVAEIESRGLGTARFYRADLASLEDVLGFAHQIAIDYDRLDVLINNAGIATTRSGEREESVDGYELVFAVNYLAGFLLTHELLPLLEQSAPARIINVSSLAQSPVDFDNVMLDIGWNNFRAYGQSKLAQILFTFSLAEDLEGSGIMTTCLHPATMMDTNMVEELGATPRTSVDEGAEAVMHLVTGTDVENGAYYVGLTPGRANDQAYDEDIRRRLWEASLAWTGIE